MGKTHVSINEILKHRRLSCNLENASLKNFSDVKSVFDNALNCSPSVFDKKYDELIQLVTCTTESANRSYNYPLLALEKSENKDISKYITNYCEAVVPKLDSDSLANLEDTIDQYSFGEEVKDKLKGVIETNIIAARILNNHDNILVRCDDIENIVTNSMRLGESVAADQIREYVDTYSIRPYQKMNLCLEELFYILGKNNTSYDKSAMVKAVVESFILSGYNEKKENYIKVLENNYVFNEEDTQAAIDMLANKDGITGTIQSIIDEYIRVGNIPFIDFCTNIGGCSINDIKLNIGLALDFMWKCVNSGQITYEEMNEGIVAMFESMANKIATSEELMSMEDLKDICASIENYISTATDKARSDLYTDDESKMTSYLNAINIARDQFIKDCSYLYNRNNIDTIYQLNQEATTVSLQEFKKFRFNNLIKGAINLDKYVRAKAKSVFDKAKLKNPLKKNSKSNMKLKGIMFTTPSGASVLFGENFGLENYIGEDGKADITVCQFYYDESSEIEIKDFCDTTCKEFNQTIKDPNMRAYYIFNPGIGEVHLKENVKIELTEEEKVLVNTSVDPSSVIYMEMMSQFDSIVDKLIDLDSFSDKIIDQKAIITNEQFRSLIEALQYLNVPKADVEAFAEKYTEYRYRALVSEGAESLYEAEVSELPAIIESYTPTDDIIPLNVQIEAASIICDILETGIKKPNIKKAEIKKADAGGDKKSKDEDDDYEDDEDYDDDSDDNDEDDSDEDKKDEDGEKEVTPEEKKKIDDMFDPREGENKGFGKLINSIRLALKGLRAKIGDLGSKEQEASKNLDAGADHLLKAMHDALVSDRREAIIKGSVIPSFSRCIKAGLALVGGGAISMAIVHSILPVIILSFGAFALSKKLTQRERMLLLDDIETELDVVEKEIGIAESKNQMKKYRALLKYKKDLQRQYQRIKYNHRIGKDLMPNSATGVYKPEG